MARVEWSRMSGDEVEELVAMLLCRRYPRAGVVRASVGDGGIDVIVPSGPGPDAPVEVYQVKKFTSNLTPANKRQIKKSITRFDEFQKAQTQGRDFLVVWVSTESDWARARSESEEVSELPWPAENVRELTPA